MIEILKRVSHPDGHELQLQDHGLGADPRFIVVKTYAGGQCDACLRSFFNFLADAEQAYRGYVAQAYPDHDVHCAGGEKCTCVETPCPKREDKQHCVCWYDGELCCACGEK